MNGIKDLGTSAYSAMSNLELRQTNLLLKQFS